MTRPKPSPAPPAFDPAIAYPRDYEHGVASANRLIDEGGRYRGDRVRFALARVTRHMENWPKVQGKNGLSDRQWARSAGFAHTLREYREGQGS